MIYLNGNQINVTLFPDNTSQVWKIDEWDLHQVTASIRWEFTHEAEVLHLAQLTQLLYASGIEKVFLHIEYLPYGRQDKSISNNTTFALHSFADIINSMHFTEIFIMDPHSEIALGLIKKSQAVYPHGPLGLAIKATGADLICYPDNGALIKYVDIYKTDIDYIYGQKVRDQETGYISSYHLKGRCEDKIVLIVDDICDGGKTFEILSKDLYLGGAENVHLFVTHGLFSKGLRPLKRAGIDMIFTKKGRAIEMSDGGLGFKPYQ